MPELILHNLSRIAYQAALDIQRDLVARVQADGGQTAHLLLLEHDPPVITLGRRGQIEHILADRARLDALGIEVHRSHRGGQVTVHAPGQLVAYPILRLGPGRGTVSGYVRALEQAVIDVLGRFGLEGRRRDGTVGVWAGEGKIASVGVAVERWVTYHGLAINVGPDTAAFDLIVPCGQSGAAAVASISQLLGREVTVARAAEELVPSLCQALGFDRAVPADAPPPPGATDD